MGQKYPVLYQYYERRLYKRNFKVNHGNIEKVVPHSVRFYRQKDRPQIRAISIFATSQRCGVVSIE